MLTLAWDTETDGLVLDREKPSHPGQPHLVELGCVLYDGEESRVVCNLVVYQPLLGTIPEKATSVHGLSFDMTGKLGVPLVVACAIFSNLVKLSDRQVGHNTQFDIKLMQAEFHRLGRPFPVMNPLCTRELSEPILKLPPTERMIKYGHGDKFKSPNLTECWRFFFDEPLIGAHGAQVDARASARVLFEIERRNAAHTA